MSTTTILADTPEYTVTQIVGDAPGNVSTQTVYKAGSATFNEDNAARLSCRVTAKLIRFALGQFDAN